MQGYTVRFSINGVYNQSDPFEDESVAENYADQISNYGGIQVINITQVSVERKAHFANTGKYA